VKSSDFKDLEVLVHLPADRPRFDTPLLFIHGAYTGAWCWEEYFLPFFAEQGWPSYAVSLSGHGGSRKPGLLGTYSIDDYVADVAEVIAQLPKPPVLIGHSMGGMVVQKYLEKDNVPGAVLLCSVPPQGLLSSAVGLMMTNPSVFAELNSIITGGQGSAQSLKESLFHQPVDDEALMRYYDLCQPESYRAIWDMTWFNLPNIQLMHRPPMLLLGARHDRLITPDQVELTGLCYGLEAEILPDVGHGVMLEKDWQKAASRIAAWLREQHFDDSARNVQECLA